MRRIVWIIWSSFVRAWNTPLKRTKLMYYTSLFMGCVTIAVLLSVNIVGNFLSDNSNPVSTLALMDIIKLHDVVNTPSDWLIARHILEENNLSHIRNLTNILSAKHQGQTVKSVPHQRGRESIAIGCAITSRGICDKYNNSNIPWENKMVHLPFFKDLAPSFCRTASPGYDYHFYVAHDFDDPWFRIEEARQGFANVFTSVTNSLCNVRPDNSKMKVRLQLVSSPSSGKPARAQNDALMEAYNDGKTEFFYRVNDDTSLGTPRWTEIFIDILYQYDPPLVGVVGPTFHANAFANYDILTYEFVHRTHVDIFKFYYPSLLTAWYADDWITRVYQPGRCIKVNDVKIIHTQKLGRRYATDVSIKDQLLKQIRQDRETLHQWITHGQEKV